MSVNPDAGSKVEPSEKEVGERIAILKRFKELLIEQRKRFQNYLEVLDKQKNIIESGKPEDLLSHVELEEKIVVDIFKIQKSVKPMQALYKAVWKGKDAPEIPEITAALDNLKAEASRQVQENKELLQKRMVVIRNEIKNIRSNPYKARKSVYADQNQPSLIDIKG
ncbi:hypothetical protein AGMMS50212_14740 [Spirochaetia bacterium]|nr:hypothetical protein AGMMS50212_14740 [Spirochaetia bacterium]